jgi:predicted anti-sigma-YlaC factor YlaD
MLRVAPKIRLALIAIALFLVHYTIEFFAWAQHPGNSAMSGGIGTVPWSILSFPLFYVVSKKVSTESFGLMLIANSVFWSVCITVILSRRARAGASE